MREVCVWTDDYFVLWAWRQWDGVGWYGMIWFRGCFFLVVALLTCSFVHYHKFTGWEFHSSSRVSSSETGERKRRTERQDAGMAKLHLPIYIPIYALNKTSTRPGPFHSLAPARRNSTPMSAHGTVEGEERTDSCTHRLSANQNSSLVSSSQHPDQRTTDRQGRDTKRQQKSVGWVERVNRDITETRI